MFENVASSHQRSKNYSLHRFTFKLRTCGAPTGKSFTLKKFLILNVAISRASLLRQASDSS